MNAPMNKGDLVRRLSARTGFSKSFTNTFVIDVFDEIGAAVARGERVGLQDFGVFEAVERSPRTARNPHTGERIDVPAKMAPVFRPSAAFKRAVRDQDQAAETDAADG